METKLTFRLHEIMISRGLSVLELAQLSGLSRPTIYALRDNTADGVQLSTLEMLCTALQIQPGELFAVWVGTKPPYPNAVAAPAP